MTARSIGFCPGGFDLQTDAQALNAEAYELEDRTDDNFTALLEIVV